MSHETQTKILVVEDNPLTVRVLIEHLKKLGYETPIARGGEEALRLVSLDKPDLILLDILLPGIDGFETCRRLKGNTLTKEIPVLFITALTETSDRVKAFEVGGVDFITKPIDFREVAARIETRLTIQKLQRRLQTKNTLLASKNPVTPEKQRPCILIVEDNPMTLQLLGKYLAGLDFNVLFAKTGEEGLHTVETIIPDIILLDVMLPGMDGFETCRRLKSNSATRDVPVIFMTALSEMADKVKAFEAGAADYITKPHHYAEVVARINTHLTLRTLQRQLQK